MDRMDEVKKIIRSLLVSAPLKVTVSSLNRDYRDLDGTYIPYKELGYNSLLHFLHSLPDILKVNGSSNESEVTLVVSEKIAHVNDLVMKQKKPSKGKNRCVKRKSVIPSETIRIPINNNYNSASTQVVSQNLVSTAPVLSPFPRPLLTYNKNVPSLPKCSNSVLKNDQTEVSQNLSRRNDIPEIKLNLEKLKLHKLNQNKTHKECDSNHVSEFYEYNQEKKIVKGRVNEENKVLNVLNNITVTFRNDLIDEEVGIVNIAKGKSEKIPLEIQNNLKILISKYPFGILCTQLPSVYEKLFRKDLDFEKHGFASLISLCMVLENIFHCQQESSYDFRLYDRNKPISTIKHTNEYPSGSSLNTSINDTLDPFAIEITNSVDWDQFTNLVPKDALRLGEKVENDLLDKFNINDRIQIVVSEICDPGRFWIYKDDGLLDDMMNSMQPFYREHKPYYLIPEILFEVGLYCVVHLNEFQRGLIVDLLPNIGGHVKVYFIDYGTMVILPKEKIWFLTREFSVLPAQAVKAKLANIKPIEQIWTMESSQRFREFVDSKHVFAKITGSEQNTLSMYIADNAKPLKFVNDVLVEEKHANYLNKEASSSGRTEKNRALSKLKERIRMRKQKEMKNPNE